MESICSQKYLGRGLQSIFIVKYFLKLLRAEILVYENWHSEIIEIKTTLCIRYMTLNFPHVCLSRKLALRLTVKYHAQISILSNLKKYLTIKSIVILGPDLLSLDVETKICFTLCQ